MALNRIRIGKDVYEQMESAPERVQAECFLRVENDLLPCANGQDALRKYQKFIANHGGGKLMASTGSLFVKTGDMYYISQNGRLWQLEEVAYHVARTKR